MQLFRSAIPKVSVLGKKGKFTGSGKDFFKKNETNAITVSMY